ncbi:diguanylate cyclase (GGDEF)-like protein/PAS domain S-box-containing protein [Paraburkholderia bannensis]|uniref:Diguanylate cyclase (GGDEF)-like protein/PAS domain S-box-containing protein n=1 Tax=Paraburkholderia bannensis TaxID=765414 RepID=A0A7W9U230_9BURK|nr:MULTISPECIES: sensor domain-containing phosphodiesterase [Paraburkholderia]MBB3259509.1 diguanylate cyclase (GGDEF)-like protein/PAS domain S-box-containing protein [Paraburkholderia sp. WP4_3_2]MBB6104525.1 diguanylate cyclase (GGDEF)-like protein/PAS domain S-box-containing protein [Paraburkholderia bannensis]
MEANRITAPRPGWLRTVIDRLRARAGRGGTSGAALAAASGAPLVPAADRAAFAKSVHAPNAADGGGAPAPHLPVPHSDAISRSFEQTAAAVDFLVHVDRNLRFLYVSDASLRFAGYHREFLLGATLHDLVAPEHLARLDALFVRALESGGVEKTTVDLIKALTYPMAVELRVQRASYAGMDGFAIAGFDVSAWQGAQARLMHALHHDPLTGLPNQAALGPALERAQAEADAHGVPVALLLLDLDDYQRVNRALGYDAGDELLRETARRLSHLALQGELIARIGSDEFAILITPQLRGEPGDIRVAAEALARRLLTSVLQPYTFRDQPVHLSASIGIAFHPDQRIQSAAAPATGAEVATTDAPADGHPDTTPLIRRADQALQTAKAAGGNTLMLHVPDNDPTDALLLKLESDLYDGVRNGEFSLHFQPITSSATRGVVGVEALIRWQHPLHGLVPPSTFIPLAESVGLINYLGNWVLKAACMQLTQWDEQGIALQYIAVNVSPQQFRNPRFKDSVQEAIQLTGLDPRRLVFEITESLLMQDPQHAVKLLEELTGLGIRFAVDDFGTGYSSLAYLQRFPLSKLKIDRSFVENLLTSRNDQAIVNAVVGLARTLELELVAEGVETEEQRELLTKMGCDHIQGWLVCKALPSEELSQRFESRSLHVHRVH